VDDVKDILDTPLLNDPDSIWEYVISMDYVGLVVEKLSGMKLGEVCKKNIFEPLGLRNITIVPSAEQKTIL
jgi:CubicO group peptidase (beta-lactamase class C family)